MEEVAKQQVVKQQVVAATTVAVATTENSPDMLSGATSFSGLTIPGHGKIRVLGKHGPIKIPQQGEKDSKEENSPQLKQDGEKLPAEDDRKPPSGEKLATLEEVDDDVSDDVDSDSSDQLSDFNDCSDDILQQAIKMGIKSSVLLN